jgi:hypothetical protein
MILNDTCQTLLESLIGDGQNNVKFSHLRFRSFLIFSGDLKEMYHEEKNLTKCSDSNANTKEVSRTARRVFKRFGTECKNWFLTCYSN